jgi:hypothetical protein
MSKPSTTPTVTERASLTSDPAVLLGLLAEATADEASYITGRLQTVESLRRTDGMRDRISRIGNVGEAIVITAAKRYDAGLVKASDGTAVVLSSDARNDMTMADLRRGLGLAERTDRYPTGDGRSVAYTDLQRYWQIARASADDIDEGLAKAEADGKGNVESTVIAAVASATFRRTDPTKAADRATKAAEAKAKREAEKAEAKREEEAFSKVSADVSPVSVDEEWTLDQCRAAVMVLNARITVIKAEAKAAAAAAAKAEEAAATLGTQSVDTLRALLAKAEAEAAAAEEASV